MSTPDERVEARVEVTPELLATLEHHAKAAQPPVDCPLEVRPAVVLALVQRIRELESESLRQVRHSVETRAS